MAILVTGVAGFIGFHTARTLLERGEEVVGLDNLNAYYDVGLKRARLAELAGRPGFTFVAGDVTDREALAALGRGWAIGRIVHLAAQAGVRYSLEQPRAYIAANIAGQLEILEFARQSGRVRHVVYASSSSVYGGSTRLPFGLDDPCDQPQSLYAATKRAGELMAMSYAHLYGIALTGLRFFTVYGPWGRPDMAPMLFARAILAGEPIALFNHGAMERDFTYIDDIVAGVVAALDRPAEGARPHRLYNLGNSRCITLVDFVAALEAACGRAAIRRYLPFQPGDVAATHADISASAADLGFAPKTPIAVGLPAFVAWLRGFDGT